MQQQGQRHRFAESQVVRCEHARWSARNYPVVLPFHLFGLCFCKRLAQSHLGERKALLGASLTSPPSNEILFPVCAMGKAASRQSISA